MKTKDTWHRDMLIGGTLIVVGAFCLSLGLAAVGELASQILAKR